MPDVFWAAFGGGAAAGVFTLLALAFAEWLRRFLDRPLVKCELTVGLMLQDSQSTETVFFIARNPHSKSVTLSGCGLTYKQKMGNTYCVSSLVSSSIGQGQVFHSKSANGRIARHLKKFW